MRPIKLLTTACLFGFFALLGWYAYGAWIQASIPAVQIRTTSPQTTRGERALPFFELMSPLPSLEKAQALPKLEYKKGPPDRFIEKISVLFQSKENGPKERLTYYGRRSRSDLVGLFAFPDEPAREARYIETALRLSQGEDPGLSAIELFLLKPFLLTEASRFLRGVESVTIMDQAGTPAFLFESPPGENGRARASALFVRRNSFYRVDYAGDRGFSVIDPLELFRLTFLTSTRTEALGFIARNLSEVKLSEPEGSKNLKIRDVAWPTLLLAAHVSVDPASVDTFFHFAGLNALLYRAAASAVGDAAPDMEISDTLRNNVLASDSYARDVAPEAGKTREIARFTRLLTRNFE